MSCVIRVTPEKLMGKAKELLNISEKATEVLTEYENAVSELNSQWEGGSQTLLDNKVIEASDNLRMFINFCNSYSQAIIEMSSRYSMAELNIAKSFMEDINI